MDSPAPFINILDARISVIIPTFMRPDGLAAAAQSILGQQPLPAGHPLPEFELVVVDNDPEQSAKIVMEELAAAFAAQNIRFIGLHEPRPGVAHARNLALKHASGQFIAFLDDDEVAFPDWLAHHVAAFKEIGADVSFGPIKARLPATSGEPRAYFEGFFSRLMDGPTRELDDSWGCGNSFMRRDTAFGENQTDPFDPKANETGGEDDLVYHALKARGGKFGWAASAWVYEDVPTQRASWVYLIKRSFAYGHNTTAQNFESETPHYIRGGLSMVKGLVQGLGMGFVFVAFRLVGHSKWPWAYDKMWRGWGKLLWFGPFKQNFYGQAAIKRAQKAKKT